MTTMTMTTASRIKAHQLVPFFRETMSLNPSVDEVEHYIAQAQPSGRSALNLRRWQRAETAGDIETDVCTNCWAISVLDAGHQEEGILLTACEDCQRTICNFCHVDEHDGEDDDGDRGRCRCGKCADQARLNQ